MQEPRTIQLTGGWDTRISRRTLLRTGGSLAAGAVLMGRTAPARSAPPFNVDRPFSLGVASGDPTPGGFVLWTRLLPEGSALDGSAMTQEPYGVRYEVAADPHFRQIVRRGTQEALWEESHTVHAEIAGLEPDRWYWYRFKWGTAISDTGRTRTAPQLGSSVEHLRFAVASCQNWPGGYYPAYADMAAQDLDLVVHLGDYIYEANDPNGEIVQARMDQLTPAHECLSLADYRTRHALYKSDEQLQAAHHRFPWLPTWDDHEVANNYAGLVMDPEVPLNDAKLRRAAAYLAFWEHQPLSRSRKPVDENMPIYRRASWGGLVTFHVLDTRQYRSDQIAACPQPDRLPSGYCPAAFDEGRTMLGAEQEDWLKKGLQATPSAGWNVVANQVGFAPEDLALNSAVKRFNADSWDGYAYSRKQLLDVIGAQPVKNTVVITGDKHYNSVRHVPPDEVNFTAEPIATEFIGGSITSGGHFGDAGTPPTADNPHHLWKDRRHGYVRVDVEPTTWRADYRLVQDVRDAGSPSWFESSWVVANGEPRANRVEVPSI